MGRNGASKTSFWDQSVKLEIANIWCLKPETKKSNLVLDLVTLYYHKWKNNMFGIFFHRVGPYIEVLVLVMPNCHQRELSPVKLKRWPVLRKHDRLRNVIWILQVCWKSFVNALQMYFQQWGVLSLKLERLRILEKLLLEKFFPEISNSFGNKVFFFFWMRCLSEFK